MDGIRRGILRDFLAIHTAGLGELAIEDSQTHEIELVTCCLRPGIKAIRRYKDQEIYWCLDASGLLATLKPVKAKRIGFFTCNA